MKKKLFSLEEWSKLKELCFCEEMVHNNVFLYFYQHALEMLSVTVLCRDTIESYYSFILIFKTGIIVRHWIKLQSFL